MPDAWGTSAATLDAPLIPALAFAVVRMAYLALYLYVAADDRRLRVQLLLDAIPQSLGLITLIGGAMLGGAAQTVLCAAAFAIDFGGARITSNFSGYKLRSPSHFAERHARDTGVRPTRRGRVLLCGWFAPTTTYDLVWDERRYPPKAVRCVRPAAARTCADIRAAGPAPAGTAAGRPGQHC